jgi:hypothetical protein
MYHGKSARYRFDKRMWPTGINRTPVVHPAVTNVRRCLAAAETDVCTGFTDPSG